MSFLRALLVPGLCLVLPAAAFAQEEPPAAPAFGQAELEALVRELLPHVPENPGYRYPLEIVFNDTDVVNASAGYDLRDGVKQSVLLMERGLVQMLKGEVRLLRAVIAHELAHLALGHSLSGFGDADLESAHTRQEEWAADEVGAGYLELAGGSREDFVDLFQAFDANDKATGMPWLYPVAGDHGSAMLRAARITGGEALLAAVARMEIGFAYMECRRFEAAGAFFEQALALEPGLHEARFDAASAALQDYYDRLPPSAQDEWLRPEFGPMLTDTILMQSRAVQVSDEDRARYGHALARIGALPEGVSEAMRRFLFATARVLHPGGDEAALAQGVSELEAMLAALPEAGLWDANGLRLRVANNLALGLARLGKHAQALRTLVTVNLTDPAFVYSAAENIARLPLRGALDLEQARSVVVTLRLFLNWTPADAPGVKEAQRAYDALLAEHSLEIDAQPERADVALCSAVSLVIGGVEVGLFEEFGKVSRVFGDMPYKRLVDAAHPELAFLFWGEDPATAEILALAEGTELVKLTSYRPDTVLELRPQRNTGLQTVYRVRVGMSADELERLLAPSGGSAGLGAVPHSLHDHQNFATEQRPGGALSWCYYPTLDFGVLLEDGRVTGIAVTPVSG